MKSDSVKSTVSWRALLDEAIHNFSEAGLPEIEARWITEEAAGGQLIGVSFEELVTNRAMAHYDNLISRRLNGEPLQYVLGHWQFRKLDLMVDQRVSEGPRIPFFNKGAHTTTIPAQIALKYCLLYTSPSPRD